GNWTICLHWSVLKLRATTQSERDKSYAYGA
ncbi:MAG: hypothetical protein JWM17_1356, partial [Actinobacteria bacterium]|nr:hypothetical protein [Actinomycetota bacterium]